MVQGKQAFVPDPVGHAEALRFGAPMDPRSVLDQIVRDGARQMLQAALEDAVNAFLEKPMHPRRMGTADARSFEMVTYHPGRSSQKPAASKSSNHVFETSRQTQRTV